MTREPADSRPLNSLYFEKEPFMSRLSLLYGDTANAPDRILSLPAAGTTQLAAESHANKLILVGFATSAVTIKLPQAVGSGDSYRVLNTVTRTSGSLTFQ